MAGESFPIVNPGLPRARSPSQGPMSTTPMESEAAGDIFLSLTGDPPSIPSKYFYDDRGSELFDAITELPEYYPTRSEQGLLDRVSDEIAGAVQATELAELGAGSARKTRRLIQAMTRGNGRLRYIPMDISQFALREAEESVGREFPGVEVKGIRCDYTRSLEALNPLPGSLTAFLGSTIGNFPRPRAVRLLRRLRSRLHPGDHFLLGVDLVKPVEILEAAYNDAQGVTAAFNKNILKVVNREAQGNFRPDDFQHLAFFNEMESQIEMHLVARKPVRVRLERFDLDMALEPGDGIRTEISRKFTEASCAGLLKDGGFHLERWFASEDNYFGLALARAMDKGE